MTRAQIIQAFRNAYDRRHGHGPPRAKLASLVSWIDEDVIEETRELEREIAIAETLNRGVLAFPTREPAERLMDAQAILAEARDEAR